MGGGVPRALQAFCILYIGFFRGVVGQIYTARPSECI